MNAKSSVVAWQDYASGILKPEMTNDNTKVRKAVSDIFKHFDFRAKK